MIKSGPFLTFTIKLDLEMMQGGLQSNAGACAGDMWDIVFTTTFTCKRCQYRASYLRDVERHIIYAHCGEVPYQCAACLSLFLSSSEALDHVQQLHGSRSRHIIENGPARWRQFQTVISRCSLVLDVDHVAGTLFLCALCEQMRTHDFAEMLRHLVATHKWWLAQPTTTCNVCAYQRIARISELDILRVEDLMSYNGHALGACLRSCFKIVLRNAGPNEAWGSSAGLLQRMGFQANVYPLGAGFKEPVDRRKVTFMWQPNAVPVGMPESPAPSPAFSAPPASPCDCGDASYCPVIPAQNAQQPLGASTLQLMEAINQRYRGGSAGEQNVNNSMNSDLTSIMRRPSMRGRWRRRNEIRGLGMPRRSLSFDGPGPTSAERLASLCANSLSNAGGGGDPIPGGVAIKQEGGGPAMDPSLIFSLLQNQHFSASASLLLNQRNTSSGKAFLPPHSSADDKRTLTGRLAAMWGIEQYSSGGASGFSNGATTSSGVMDSKSKAFPGTPQPGDWCSDTTSSEESGITSKDQISSLENYMSSKYLGISKQAMKGKLQRGSFSETLDNLAKHAAASASGQKDTPLSYGSYEGKSVGGTKGPYMEAAVEDAVPDSSMAFSSDNSEHEGSDHAGTPLDLSKIESKLMDGAGAEDNMDYAESNGESPLYEPLKPDQKGVVNIIPVDLSVSKKAGKYYGFSGLPLDLTRKEDALPVDRVTESKQTRTRKQSTPSKAVMEDFSEVNEKGEHEKDPANEDLMRVLDRFFGDLDSAPFGSSNSSHIMRGIGSRPPSDSDTEGVTSPASGTGSDASRSQTAKSPDNNPISNGSTSCSSNSPPGGTSEKASTAKTTIPQPKQKSGMEKEDDRTDRSSPKCVEPKYKNDIGSPGKSNDSKYESTSNATGKVCKSLDNQFIDLTSEG